ncbi:MAG: DUF2189 domain-containing protein [Rhizobiaceae bacterium]
MTGSTETATHSPQINHIGVNDVFRSLREGFSDFTKAPMIGLFFGGFYALGGLIILAALNYFHQSWMIFPVAIGFPLIGPFIAAGLYETSRRLSAGEPIEWSAIIGVVFKQRERELGWMAFVVLFIFWIWMYQIRLLTALFLGSSSMSSVQSFLDVISSTSDGFAYLFTGTIVGGVLALVLFSTTVISMPLLMDREYDFVTALITSIRAVLANLIPMLTFGLIVTILAFLALAPFFLGLLIVLPVLGHATWHLYKKVIV